MCPQSVHIAIYGQTMAYPTYLNQHRPWFQTKYFVCNPLEHLFFCQPSTKVGNIKTFSCRPVRYFGTLFWDDITLFWDEICYYLLF